MFLKWYLIAIFLAIAIAAFYAAAKKHKIEHLFCGLIILIGLIALKVMHFNV